MSGQRNEVIAGGHTPEDDAQRPSAQHTPEQQFVPELQFACSLPHRQLVPLHRPLQHTWPPAQLRKEHDAPLTSTHRLLRHTLPQHCASLEQLVPNWRVQVEHDPMPVPNWLHSPEQHVEPVWQLALVTVQFRTHCCPLQVSFELQKLHCAPPRPQAKSLVPVTHVLPSQQPLGQLAALHEQLPPWHAEPLGHAKHESPNWPHALFAVPGRHCVPWQQPAHVPGSQRHEPF